MLAHVQYLKFMAKKEPNKFKSFAADFMRTGKDQQSVVQQLLQNGSMTDVQFKQLGQMASQILKIGRFLNVKIL